MFDFTQFGMGKAATAFVYPALLIPFVAFLIFLYIVKKL